MQHSPGFLKVVEQARAAIREISIDDARAVMASNPQVVLLDVREDHEWQAEHATEAQHLGKGILERDLETRFPDKNTTLIMYCGGGFRSALTCEVAQRMGYPNVRSLVGGFKGMKAAGWPTTS
jgi:rhodanese-related sulfurtransferase